MSIDSIGSAIPIKPIARQVAPIKNSSSGFSGSLFSALLPNR